MAKINSTKKNHTKKNQNNTYRKKKYAPLLMNKTTRLKNETRMDPLIKAGLMAIARQEGRSMSWVVEEVISDYFDLKGTGYKNYVYRGGQR